MKLSANRPAVTFTRDHEEATQLLCHLHGLGFSAVPDGEVRPRITVAGCSQERLNELVDTWRRRCFEARRARELREGQP